MSREEDNCFRYHLSYTYHHDVKIKIGTLEGKLPRPDYEQVIEDPILRFAGRNQSNCPDLLVSAVVTADNVPLHLPVTTSYKNFNQRWDWNQWLKLPIKFPDLPSNALLCLTIWDCNGPGKKVAVGGTSIFLFSQKDDGDSKTGIFRTGMEDLVVWPNAEGSKDTPGKPKDSDKEQYHRLAKLTKRYNDKMIPHVDWLDPIAFAEMARISQKEKSSASKMHLEISFPETVDGNKPHYVVYYEAGKTEVHPPIVSDLCPLPDPDIGEDNLIEAKHHKLARSLGQSEKPNPEMRDKLNAILLTPVTQILTSEEQDLIWKYRYYLADKKKALSKFVRIVKWSVKVEADVAMDLINNKWEPMDVEDALELVGPNTKHPGLRRYAISRLNSAKDEQLEIYLPQLVQALKYENQAVSLDEDEENITDNLDLASFLIDRAKNVHGLANSLFWNLHIETEERDYGKMYKEILERFLAETEFKEILERQLNFIQSLVKVFEKVTKIRNRDRAVDEMRKTFSETEKSEFNFTSFEPIPFPLDPSISICGIIPDDSTLFKSTVRPAKLTFLKPNGDKYETIFKVGDDLRQDQLVLQIISLMDDLLKKENLDLKLTPYRALATSSNHGFVQFVKAKGVRDILEKESILEFLQKYNASKSEPNGVTKECMDTYVKSCAGYCVITYILGIGDRHLDNLMMTENGNLFHIDFGFILGRDPKPFPPPMKLNKDMIAVFDPQRTPQNYAAFKNYCQTAFENLRRNASLILNLFGLMVDSSVPEIALEPDKAVKKVQDKFLLHLTEEEAGMHLQKIIDESAKALFPDIIDWLHGLAMIVK